MAYSDATSTRIVAGILRVGESWAKFPWMGSRGWHQGVYSQNLYALLVALSMTLATRLSSSDAQEFLHG